MLDYLFRKVMKKEVCFYIFINVIFDELLKNDSYYVHAVFMFIFLGDGGGRWGYFLKNSFVTLLSEFIPYYANCAFTGKRGLGLSTSYS